MKVIGALLLALSLVVAALSLDKGFPVYMPVAQLGVLFIIAGKIPAKAPTPPRRRRR